MRKLLILLSFLLFVGCAPNLTMIDSRGRPIPTEFVQLKSLYGIRTDFHFKRIYEKSEESLYPEFLPIERKVTLPRNTKAVVLVLHIFNPQAVKLRVKKCVEVDGHRTIKILYEGRDVDRVFQLNGPLEGRNVELWSTVEVNGRIVVLAGRALYRNPRRKDPK